MISVDIEVTRSKVKVKYIMENRNNRNRPYISDLAMVEAYIHVCTFRPRMIEYSCSFFLGLLWSPLAQFFYIVLQLALDLMGISRIFFFFFFSFLGLIWAFRRQIYPEHCVLFSLLYAV